jgi:hypothetical protein
MPRDSQEPALALSGESKAYMDILSGHRREVTGIRMPPMRRLPLRIPGSIVMCKLSNVNNIARVVGLLFLFPQIARWLPDMLYN